MRHVVNGQVARANAVAKAHELDELLTGLNSIGELGLEFENVIASMLARIVDELFRTAGVLLLLECRAYPKTFVVHLTVVLVLE